MYGKSIEKITHNIYPQTKVKTLHVHANCNVVALTACRQSIQLLILLLALYYMYLPLFKFHFVVVILSSTYIPTQALFFTKCLYEFCYSVPC